MKATRHDEITQLLATPHPPVWTAYEYWERIEQLEKALAEALAEVERDPDLPLFGLFENGENQL
jgi:hypothetical protein